MSEQNNKKVLDFKQKEKEKINIDYNYPSLIFYHQLNKIFK